MSRLQVTCIEKRGSHYNPHERIIAIGGKNSLGTSWKKSESDAIRAIENKEDQFYVIVNGREVDVIIATRLGRKYLKTEADDYAPNNLLSLKDC
jgi:hypothetical protein